MKISVIICTWNRATLLDRTLTQMRALRIPPALDWELLVVNNNCSDDTDGIISRHEAFLPLRRLFEPTLGKTYACNSALDSATGDLLVWTDDDVLVEPDWIAAYASAAERWPGNSYFGGPVIPWYESPPPAWVNENLDLLKGMLTLRDLAIEEGLFPENEMPFGANMALRREAFSNFRFNPALGPIGGSLVMCEETSLFLQLRKNGDRGVWVPQAKVRHFVPQTRMTREYLWTWARGYGRGITRIEIDSGAE
ncbi:MAG TPA: glycosyltransferase, partial [Oligoflexia bacterium]|nr:glycosyltransferase [Oligoflexia bacterium]